MVNVQFVKSAVFPYGPAPSDEKRAFELIEICGRTAYKSEDKITESSAKSFVLMLKTHGHLSVLEHSNIALKVELKTDAGVPDNAGPISFHSILSLLKDRLGFHRIFPLNGDGTPGFILVGNFRAWLETLEYLKEREPLAWRFFAVNLGRSFPNLFEIPQGGAGVPHRATILTDEEQLRFLKDGSIPDLPVFVFRFVCDRGITHEVVRHRVFSFTQESTRYVNYRNRGMILVLPEELQPYYDEASGEFTDQCPVVREWQQRADLIFDWYREDLARGLRPEIARDILPNLLKSEILVSGRFSGWKHFVKLRESSQAHPRIRFLAKGVRKYFEEELGVACD